MIAPCIPPKGLRALSYCLAPSLAYNEDMLELIATCAAWTITGAPLHYEQVELPRATIQATYDPQQKINDRLLAAVVAKPVVKVDGCNVVVGYDNVKLIMARELRRSQCLYKVNYEHELEHVNIYKDALAKVHIVLDSKEAVESAVKTFFNTVRQSHRVHDKDVSDENGQCGAHALAKVLG